MNGCASGPRRLHPRTHERRSRPAFTPGPTVGGEGPWWMKEPPMRDAPFLSHGLSHVSRKWPWRMKLTGAEACSTWNVHGAHAAGKAGPRRAPMGPLNELMEAKPCSTWNVPVDPLPGSREVREPLMCCFDLSVVAKPGACSTWNTRIVDAAGEGRSSTSTHKFVERAHGCGPVFHVERPCGSAGWKHRSPRAAHAAPRPGRDSGVVGVFHVERPRRDEPPVLGPAGMGIRGSAPNGLMEGEGVFHVERPDGSFAAKRRPRARMRCS